MTQAQRAAATLDRWRWHPEAMVREEFGAEPDAWQLEALRLFPHNERLALKACKGPGKTAVLAWLILNFLATRPHPRIGATSITGDNLKTNLWPELSKWMARSAFMTALFTWSAEAVRHKVHGATWFAVARTWPKSGSAEQQADALAGLHADYVLYVVDESGGIPQAVMVTVEAVLSTGTETKVVQAGNPTHTTGPLYRACTIDRALWKVVTITGDPDSPLRSPRIKIEWAKQQIASYGRDNPWVMVNVLGEFPPSSINQLLSVEEVQRAMARHLPRDLWEHSQKRLGVDVARFGDDRTVIFPRQGLASFRPIIMRHQRTDEIAARVLMAKRRWGSEMELIDNTYHWGNGVIDQLVVAQASPIGVNYAGKAIDPRFNNRRSEMWIKGAKAISKGAALPNIPEMVGELTEPTYTFSGGQFVLESKDQIKERLGRSPDLADAYMTTYAIEDLPGNIIAKIQGRNHALRDFDPFASTDAAGKAAADFDPYDVRL